MAFPNLNAEMARKGLKPVDIAQAMNVCQKTAFNKLTGVRPFTLMETVAIRNKHFPSMTIEELFLSDQKGE